MKDPYDIFYLAVAKVIIITVWMLLTCGFAVPLMLDGGAMQTFGLPILAVCFGYLLSFNIVLMIRAFRKLPRSK